jgi:hypothetical protein
LGKLNAGILKGLGKSSAMKVPAGDFNRAAEDYFRGPLRRNHFSEGLDVLADDFRRLDQRQNGDSQLNHTLEQLLNGRSAADFMQTVRRDLVAERTPAEVLGRFINLVLVSLANDSDTATRHLEEDSGEHVPATSVY